MNKSRMIKNPETGHMFLPSELTKNYGIYIDTNGKEHYTSEEEVRLWIYMVAKMGLYWALDRLFDRRQFEHE